MIPVLFTDGIAPRPETTSGLYPYKITATTQRSQRA
jgi:hypothetical protein